MLDILLGLLEATCFGAVPLVLAAQGGLVSERSGVVNISLEGGILLGAFAAAAGAHSFGSSWWGLALGSLVGCLYMVLYGVSVFVLKVHPVVSGTAFNTLAFGSTLLLSKYFFQNSSQTPLIEMERRFEYFPFIFTLLTVLALYFWMSQTASGLWNRIAGEKPLALKAAGLNVGKIRWCSLALSGLLVGTAGSFLSIWLAGFFSKGMSAGRGFMAVAAIVLGGWKLGPTVLGCLFFAFGASLQNRLQTADFLIQWGIPTEAIQAFPYLLTLGAIALVSRSRPPRALGKPL